MISAVDTGLTERAINDSQYHLKSYTCSKAASPLHVFSSRRRTLSVLFFFFFFFLFLFFFLRVTKSDQTIFMLVL